MSLIGGSWDFDVAESCRAMVDTRNWMTHWSSRTEHVADEPTAVSRFCRQLELMLYMAILRDLELEEDEIVEAVGHGWVLEHLP
jgi:hypothetical protein